MCPDDITWGAGFSEAALSGTEDSVCCSFSGSYLPFPLYSSDTSGDLRSCGQCTEELLK